MRDLNAAGAVATDYLRLFGLVVLGYMWARMAALALEKRAGDDAGFYEAKIKTARFYMQRLLPQTSGVFAAIIAGGELILELVRRRFNSNCECELASVAQCEP